VWEPFVGLLGQHRALEILAFVVLYKLGDNLTQALTGPFLVEMGFDDFDVGIAVGTVGLVAALLGTFLGGLLGDRLGLGPALWLCGILQVVSNVGYAVVAMAGANRPVMFAAVAFEVGTSGMGTGAFGVFLLRLTEQRFSATQYALLSSLFAIPRVAAGPVAGFMADAIGWRDFYLFTVLAGLPALGMLHRFVPWGVREPALHVAEPSRGVPLARLALLLRSGAAGVLGVAVAGGSHLALAAARAAHEHRAFDLLGTARLLLAPDSLADAITTIAVVVFGAAVGLGVAAVLTARRGIRVV
jgi:PAT family beta-lactamase induction signal transducer AmpG